MSSTTSGPGFEPKCSISGFSTTLSPALSTYVPGPIGVDVPSELMIAPSPEIDRVRQVAADDPGDLRAGVRVRRQLRTDGDRVVPETELLARRRGRQRATEILARDPGLVDRGALESLVDRRLDRERGGDRGDAGLGEARREALGPVEPRPVDPADGPALDVVGVEGAETRQEHLEKLAEPCRVVVAAEPVGRDANSVRARRLVEGVDDGDAGHRRERAGRERAGRERSGEIGACVASCRPGSAR